MPHVLWLNLLQREIRHLYVVHILQHSRKVVNYIKVCAILAIDI